MNTVLMIHSLVRWLILLIAVIAIIRFALGWVRNMEYRPMDRGLMSGFTGLVDLQLLLGIVLLIGMGTFPAYQIEHAITMLVVVLLAHLPIRWRNAADHIRFRNNLAVIVVALVLIIVGIAVLPDNRWTI